MRIRSIIATIAAAGLLTGVLMFAQMFPFPGNPPSGPNGFSAFKTITIDHTKVGTVNNTDQTNFPVLISGTYAYLATVANGGLVTSASGFDIVYTSDSGCTTPLNQELVNYTATTGAIEEWVKVPTVSHTVDTVIYECYGKSSITTDQSSTSTWSNSFAGVYHLGSPTTLLRTDSSGNGNNISATAGTVSASTGQIGGAASTADTSSGMVKNGILAGNIMNAVNQTQSAWVKSSVDGFITERDNGSSRTFQFRIFAGKLNYITFAGGTVSTSGATTVSDGTWRYLVGVYDGAHNIIYVNGSSDGSGVQTGSMSTTNLVDYNVMNQSTSPPPNNLQGQVDEVRIATTGRSADWIKTEYNNQLSPGTFYTIS